MVDYIFRLLRFASLELDDLVTKSENPLEADEVLGHQQYVTLMGWRLSGGLTPSGHKKMPEVSALSLESFTRVVTSCEVPHSFVDATTCFVFACLAPLQSGGTSNRTGCIQLDSFGTSLLKFAEIFTEKDCRLHPALVSDWLACDPLRPTRLDKFDFSIHIWEGLASNTNCRAAATVTALRTFTALSSGCIGPNWLAERSVPMSQTENCLMKFDRIWLKENNSLIYSIDQMSAGLGNRRSPSSPVCEDFVFSTPLSSKTAVGRDASRSPCRSTESPHTSLPLLNLRLPPPGTLTKSDKTPRVGVVMSQTEIDSFEAPRPRPSDQTDSHESVDPCTKPTEFSGYRLAESRSPRPIDSSSRKTVICQSPRPAEGRSPRPAEGRRNPRPVECRSPRPADCRSPRPAEGRSPRPAEGRSPRPAEGRSPRPAEGRSPRPAEGRSPRSADCRSPRPAEGRRPRSADCRSPRLTESMSSDVTVSLDSCPNDFPRINSHPPLGKMSPALPPLRLNDITGRAVPTPRTPRSPKKPSRVPLTSAHSDPDEVQSPRSAALKRSHQLMAKSSNRRDLQIEIYRPIASQILSQIYLSGSMVAESTTALDELSITHVLNVSGDFGVKSWPERYAYRTIFLADTREASETFESLLPAVVLWIEKILKNSKNKILIHCREGVSRSASVVIAYLIRAQMIPFNAALEAVRRSRPIVNPNIGFTVVLLKFAQRLGVNFGTLVEEKKILVVRPLSVADGQAVVGMHTAQDMLEAPGPVKLDPRFVFVLRQQETLFVWIGNLCPNPEFCLSAVDEFQRNWENLENRKISKIIFNQNKETREFWRILGRVKPQMYSEFDNYFTILSDFSLELLSDSLDRSNLPPPPVRSPEELPPPPAADDSWDRLQLFEWPNAEAIEAFDADDLRPDGIFFLIKFSSPGVIEVGWAWVGSEWKVPSRTAPVTLLQNFVRDKNWSGKWRLSVEPEDHESEDFLNVLYL